MSGYSCHHYRLAGDKYNYRKKYTEVNSHLQWKPKMKVATNGSFHNVSSCQRDNSLLTGESTSGEISSAEHRTPSNFPFQQKSLLPSVDDVASNMENLNLMPNSSQRTDRTSKQPGSFSSSGSNSRLKDSPPFSSQSWPSHGHPSAVKSKKDSTSDMAAEVQLESTSSSSCKLKDSPTFSLQSELFYKHLNAEKSQSGKSDMISETHCEYSYLVDMYSTPTRSCLVAGSGMENELSEKRKQLGQISEEKAGTSRISENSDCVSPGDRYDICVKRQGVVKLKAPLHVKNREKRNEIKHSLEGQYVIVLRPGMVLLKRYILIEDQVSIVKACRDLGVGSGGFYKPGYRDGATLSLHMMCLGKHWDPESSKYEDIRPTDNAKPSEIPDAFHCLVKGAIRDSHAHIKKKSPKADVEKRIPSLSPNICIVNFYTKGGKLGLHQDKDESKESLDKGLPVVSFSIGDSAEFLYGDERDVNKTEKVILESGDVLIFGGQSRRIFHGVASILPETAPTSLVEATDLRPGRLNLTFREF